MADGTQINVASTAGDIIATDDIAGQKFPRGKITLGADGVNDGDVSASNPLPIKGTGTAGTSNAGVLSIQGIASMVAVQVTETGAAATSLGVMDDWDESDRAKVNPIVGQAGVQGGAGAVTASTQRMVIASDATFPAPLGTTGGGTEATALRVTIASDSTGVLSVDDNGASLTVDYATTGSGTATGALRVELPTNGTGVIATVSAVTAITNALPAGSNIIGNFRIDQTTPGTTNAISISHLGANAISTGNGGTGTGVLRVAQVNDGTGVLATVTTVTTVSTLTGGNVAHDGVDAGNPHKIGGKASSTLPTDVSANDRVDALFDLKGRLVTTRKAGTSTLSNVASSASSVSLLAANTARLGISIFNDSTASLFVKFGTTASSSSFTVKMGPGDYYEDPFNWTGAVDGIWSAANGNARITEMT
jgi:hypothetical protein